MDAASVLIAIDAGLAHCETLVRQDGGLYASLFAAGLIGGGSHCAGMCGPFVLAQVTARLEAVPASRMTEFHRLTGAALIPYHLGRGTSYAALGALAATAAGGLGGVTGLSRLSAVLLAAAAVFFLFYGLRGLAGWFPVPALPERWGGLGRWWAAQVERRAQPWFARPTGWRGYVLGLALGMIPCGLLYGAVAVAAASGDPLSGALGMIAFVAGTVPSLLAVGLAGHLAGRVWRVALLRAAPVVMVVNAGVLGLLAWRQAF